jgi:hypothetical protein
MPKLNPRDPRMKELLMAAIRGGEHQRFAMLWDNLGDRFGGDGDNTPELMQLLLLHQERLIELLKQHILAFHWNDGDANALVSLIPLQLKRGEKFVEIELAFPPRTPTLVPE